MCRLKLLGGAWISSLSTPQDISLTQHHQMALLALLSQSPKGRLSRDKLVAFLWPDHSSSDARRLLNTAVYGIRHTLSKDVVLTVADDLQLNDAVVSVDANDFRRAKQEGDEARAVKLYDGPFMDGFFLDGSIVYERWAEGLREELAYAYGRALECLADEAMNKGDAPAAVEAWLKFTSHDPYNSRAVVGLMKAMTAAGNRAGAVRHARRHQRVIREDLGIEPDASVVSLARSLGGASR